MPDELVKTLREWKLRSISNEKDFVFRNANGNGIDPRNLIRRCFDPMLKRAGIDKLRWHDLRHTFASILIHKLTKLVLLMTIHTPNTG